jgi:hypothetical protein
LRISITKNSSSSWLRRKCKQRKSKCKGKSYPKRSAW